MNVVAQAGIADASPVRVTANIRIDRGDDTHQARLLWCSGNVERENRFVF